MTRTNVRIAAAVLAVAGLASAAFAFGEKASAEFKDKAGASIGGAQLVEASGGVLIKLKLKGLPVGPHALRIHDAGKCDGDFSSAGEIYNPLGSKYGFLNPDGPMAGELPNIFAANNGELETEVLSHFITLGKEAEEPLLDADGASIVIYEKASDHSSDPDGNAGARIACGAISIAK